jgi:hypothetical protein
VTTDNFGRVDEVTERKMFNGENYLEQEVIVGEKCERKSDRRD